MIISSRKILYYIISIIILCLVAYSLGYTAAFIDPKLIIGAIIGLILCGLILKQPLAGIYLLIFFLPFERIGSLDLAGVTIRISHVITILTIISWIVRGFVMGKFKFRPNPVIIPIALFLSVNIISLTNSPNLDRSIFVLLFTLFTISVALAIPNLLRHRSQLHTAVVVLLISMTVVSIFGIYQFLGDLVGLPETLTGLRPQYTKDILGFPRIQSTALEPLYFANYLLIPLGVAIALFLSKYKKIKPIFLLGAIILGGLNLVLTVSRGGYIAFAGTLAILALIYWKELIRPHNVIAGLVIVAVVSMVAVRVLNVEEQLETFTTHVGNLFEGASYSERVDTFETANTIWNQHPWIGIGPGGFGPYTSYHPLIVPGDGYKIVNNEYIELLAETGMLGLAFYILIIITLMVRSIKALKIGKDPFLRNLLIGLLAAYTGILIQYNTFSILYIIHIWFTIGIIIAVQNLLLSPNEKER